MDSETNQSNRDRLADGLLMLAVWANLAAMNLLCGDMGSFRSAVDKTLRQLDAAMNLKASLSL